MGQPKLTLPLGDATVIERVVQELRRGGCRPVVVVAPQMPELRSLVQRTGALCLDLAKPTRHMRETVEFALDHLARRFPCSPESPWLLVPADHPLLNAAIVNAMAAAWQARPDCSIVIPSFRGRRGHPVMLRWCHHEGIRRFDPCRGINAYLRQFPQETLEVVVDTADILIDLDTPEDYAKLRQRFG
jgi:molybdenum cofactor cytidylyltransferase